MTTVCQKDDYLGVGELTTIWEEGCAPRPQRETAIGPRPSDFTFFFLSLLSIFRF